MIEQEHYDNSSITDIAIIGMSCRFPGANNLNEFWNNLLQGKETIKRFTKDELLASGETEDMISRDNYISARGIVENPELFDAAFFGFSATDAKLLDPQHRLFMECGWEALEDAGYSSEKFKGLISVYASMADSTYLQNNILKNKEIVQSTDWFQMRIATSLTTLSTQFSYRLNLKGASVNLTTACSSSLVVVSTACKALLDYDCDLAVAGASVVSIPQKCGYLYQKGGISSSDGHCRAFDAEASGTVFSDGVGIVVLKRLSDAINEKDFIYAVIKGWNVNNDGAEKIGYTAPSVQGQARCIVSAANFADIDLETISYIETHGTGTAMGDPIEINAMKMAFDTQTTKKQFCAIGSVKTNIGHADIAAGMASIIKTALSLKNKMLPASLHFKKSNPAIQFEQTPFYVNDQLKIWEISDAYKRRAGINSSGIGGTNAFMILEENTSEIIKSNDSKPYIFIPISAKTQTALDESYKNLLQFFDTNRGKLDLSNVAYTLQVGRAEFNLRQALIINKELEKDSLENSLSSYIQFNKVHQVNQNKKIVFLFTGQGSQYIGMASELYHSEPNFAKIIDSCLSHLDFEIKDKVSSLLLSTEKNNVHFNDTLITQPALFIFEYALGLFLINLGVIPDAMGGHSLGEYVAACLAGVMDCKAAINLIQIRAQLMATTQPGNMLAVQLNKQDTLDRIKQNAVSIAACNSLSNTVISGDLKNINQLEEELIKNNIRVNRLNTSHAFHSPLMEPILEDFFYAAEKINFKHPSIPFLSNVTGEWIKDYEATNPRYWADHIRNPVRFIDNVQQLLIDDFNIFLEIGAGNVLTNFVREISKNKLELLIRNINNRPGESKSNVLQFFVVLAELWLRGVNISWDYFNINNPGSRLPLPTYPFNRQRFWITPSSLPANIFNNEKQTYDNWFYELSWKRISFNDEVSAQNLSEVKGNWIIFADEHSVGDRIQTFLLENEQNVFKINHNTVFTKISSYEYKINIADKEHYNLLINSIFPDTDKPIYVINLLALTNTRNIQVYEKTNIENLVDACFYSSLFLTQALIEKQYTHSLNLIAVANDLFSVLGEHISPVKSTLIGLCRIIPLEHENIKMKVLDVSLSDLLSEQQHHFVERITFEGINIIPKETLIAYRKNYKWIQSTTPIKLKKQTNIKLRKNGVFLFTGGLGGISLTLANSIVTHSENPIFILMSRSSFPAKEEWEAWLQTHEADERISKKIQALKAIEAKGAKIYFYKANIADEVNLPTAINSIKQKFGAIHGVIHSAGNPGGGLVQFKTKEIASKVFEPKIYGTYLLCSLLKNEPLDFFIICSSISSVVGEASQVDYCAANACLDAFPFSGLFEKTNTLFSVINWNTWQEVGMAVETERPSDISYFDRKNDIKPSEGAQIFLDVLNNKRKQVIISTMSLENFTEQMQNHATGHFVAPELIERESILSNTTLYQPPQNETENQLVKIWQDVFSIDKIGITDDFFILGGHSLTALHLLNKIEHQFKVVISMSVFLENATTIEKLAKIILSNTDKAESSSSIVIPIRSTGSRKPLFCFHPVAGTIFCYTSLAKYLKYDAPIYGIQDPSLAQEKLLFNSLEEMAAFYIKKIKKVQSHGAYYLAGLSFGATLAAEVARQLRMAGETIKCLIFFDGWAKFSESYNIESIFKKSIEKLFNNSPNSVKMTDLIWQRMRLLLNYQIKPIPETVYLFKAQTLLPEYIAIDEPYNYWKNHVIGRLNVIEVAGDHESILNEPNVENLAALLDNILINYNS